LDLHRFDNRLAAESIAVMKSWYFSVWLKHNYRFLLHLKKEDSL
jgi:hypothetical protein